MSRLVAAVLVTLAAAGCAGLGAQRSEAAVLVGVGDQDPLTFSDPLWKQLALKRSRFFAPWDTVSRRADRGYFDAWYSNAVANGVEMMVAFNPSRGSRCPKRPCRLPSVSSYTRAFRAFRKRYPEVKVYAPWNEANHRSQPTFRNPKRAAQYYNVVARECRKAPRCKVIVADVIDESNMVRWLKTFKRYARGSLRLWGLHNYKDTNPRKGQTLGGTRLLLRTVRGQVWLTETGGIVKFVTPQRRTLFRFSESRANRATRRMFSLARRYRSRIKRLYIYHWKQPRKANRFDAGLIRKTGRPRSAYFTVKRHLALSTFNP